MPSDEKIDVDFLRKELRHYKGLCYSLRAEVDRLTADNSNLRRKLAVQSNTTGPQRVWGNALDGTK